MTFNESVLLSELQILCFASLQGPFFFTISEINIEKDDAVGGPSANAMDTVFMGELGTWWVNGPGFPRRAVNRFKSHAELNPPLNLELQKCYRG
jgi:hypothetical protein